MAHETTHVLGDLARPELDTRTVMGRFERQPDLDAALDALKRAGFRSEQILVQGDEDGLELGAEEVRTGRRNLAGLVLGAVIGGAFGVLLALIWPGMPVVEQIGPIGSLLLFALIGLALGELFGSYTGLGKNRQQEPQNTVSQAEKELLISVKVSPDGPIDQVAEILNHHGARDVTSHVPQL
ncbi:MAG TPA: hypothetical protein VFS21_02680 [Roseiflexaceae bacterium]|nr:hypothetical protein [Roseiflexaceae bacterium]